MKLLSELIENKRFIYILAISAALIVIVVGLATDLSLGDEIYQFRFAKLWYESGSRPLYDPLMETSAKCLYYFDSDPLWALGLVLIWKIIGHISIPAMQVYQGLFYGVLIVACYYLGVTLGNKRVGFFAALIAASMPFLVAYSVVEYLDVPVACLIVVSTLFLARKQYFWAGVFFGISFLAKRNSWLFIPPLAIYLLYSAIKEKKFGLLVQFILPAGVISIPELVYKFQNWGSFFFAPSCSFLRVAAGAASAGASAITKTISEKSYYFSDFSAREWNYTPSNIFYSPMAIPQYLGIVLLGLLIAYLIFKKGKRNEFLLIWLIISYFIQFLYFFYGQWAVRYAAPVFGLMCVVAAFGLNSLIEKYESSKLLLKTIIILFILGCLVQFSGALVYTFIERKITPGVSAAYQFIKNNTPISARVLYPEYALTPYTDRSKIWIRLEELPYIFWKANQEETIAILKEYDTDFIMVKKNRIYDDTNIHHRLGYPKSFINKLLTYDQLKIIFNNDEVEIWQVAPLNK